MNHDPAAATPGLALEERRKILADVARQLVPVGVCANQYYEGAIWADVEVPLL